MAGTLYHSRCITRPFQRDSNKPHPNASNICGTKPGVVTHFLIPALEKLRQEDQGPSLRYCKVKANLGSMRFCHQNQKQKKKKKKLLWSLTLKLHYLETWLSGERCSPPNLTTGVGSLGPTWLKERTHSHKLSSDFHTLAMVGSYPSMTQNKYISKRLCLISFNE